jgi:hypothetical protein
VLVRIGTLMSWKPIRIRRQNDADPIEFGQSFEIITGPKIRLTVNVSYLINLRAAGRGGHNRDERCGIDVKTNWHLARMQSQWDWRAFLCYRQKRHFFLVLWIRSGLNPDSMG